VEPIKDRETGLVEGEQEFSIANLDGFSKELEEAHELKSVQGLIPLVVIAESHSLGISIGCESGRRGHRDWLHKILKPSLQLLCRGFRIRTYCKKKKVLVHHWKWAVIEMWNNLRLLGIPSAKEKLWVAAVSARIML
jgi:hypothetical protein